MITLIHCNKFTCISAASLNKNSFKDIPDIINDELFRLLLNLNTCNGNLPYRIQKIQNYIYHLNLHLNKSHQNNYGN